MSKLNVKDQFPNFTFNTGCRNDVTVVSVLTQRTVFWVIRYIGCTVCRYDVHLLAQKFDQIAATGTNLFVVMQSDQAHIQRDLKDANIPFEIICDSDQKIYQSLEILPAASKEEMRGEDPEKLKAKVAKARECGFAHGDYEGNELQLPALFIVEKDGSISYVHYGKDITDMPTVDELIEMLKK